MGGGVNQKNLGLLGGGATPITWYANFCYFFAHFFPYLEPGRHSGVEGINLKLQKIHAPPAPLTMTPTSRMKPVPMSLYYTHNK